MFQNAAFTIPATGETQSHNFGAYKYIFIKFASAPFLLSFDGVTFFQSSQNDRHTVTGKIVFVKPQVVGAPVNVTIYASLTPIDQQDTQVSSIYSSVRGNLGLADGFAGYGLGTRTRSIPQITVGGVVYTNYLPAVSAAGYLQVDSAHIFYLFGSFSDSNPVRRNLIVFSVSPTSAAPLKLQDFDNGNTAMIIPAGQVISLPTDSDMRMISGAAGQIASVAITEIFAARLS